MACTNAEYCQKQKLHLRFGYLKMLNPKLRFSIVVLYFGNEQYLHQHSNGHRIQAQNSHQKHFTEQSRYALNGIRFYRKDKTDLYIFLAKLWIVLAK